MLEIGPGGLRLDCLFLIVVLPIIVFSLVSARIGDERVSLLARISGVTYYESWPLVVPVDRLPAGLGVMGLPVTASA